MRLPGKRLTRKVTAGYSIGYPAFTGAEPCSIIGPDPYFEPQLTPEQEHTLREGCDACPLVQQCFDWAVYHEAYHYWAGTTAAQRREIRRKHNILLIDPTAWIEMIVRA